MSVLDSIYEDILDTIREPLLVLDPDLKVLAANRSFYKSFKVTPEETVGNLIYDLANRQWESQKLRILLEDIIPKANKFDDYEVEHVFPGQGHKIMLLNARRIIHGAQMILLAIEDITERRRLEGELKDSDDRFRRLFETAKDGLLLINKETGNIVNANKAIANLLGHSSEELIGKKLSDVGLLTDIKDFKETINELELFGLIDIVDTHIETKQGLAISVDIYLVDRARFAQCNVRDITERKLAEEELRRSRDEIEVKVAELEELNAALRVLTRQRERDKKVLEDLIAANIQELITPSIEQLKKISLDQKARACLDLLESNFREITGPFLQNLRSKYHNLTFVEIQVANLIKEGRSSKEIAESLHISRSTVDSHRNNIRRKLELRKTKTNLRTYLMSLK